MIPIVGIGSSECAPSQESSAADDPSYEPAVKPACTSVVSSTGAVAPPDVVFGLRRRDEETRWHVLHVRSRQEKALDAWLRAAGVSCYLPLRPAERRYGQRRVTSLLPLFPGYLFLWGNRDEVFLADRTKRVARLIDVPDQRQLEWELVNVGRALAGGASLDPYPALREGVRVRVLSGPFEGVEGVIRSRNAADRLVLQVRMLNTAASLDIDGHLVEPLDA
jgi:transcription termination/antitermination protein NusG